MIDVVTWEDPVIGLQVDPFNWRLRKARQARGWTRAELARRIGISPNVVGDAEKLRRISASAREKMALVLEIPEDELFPGVIDDLPKAGPGMLEVPFTEEQIERWHESRNLPEAIGDLGQDIDQGELRAAVEAALDTLTPRQSRVLRMRYGIDREAPMGLDEIGHEFGIGRERVRQIETEAIRKLRYPSRVDYLKAWRDDWPGRRTIARAAPRSVPSPMRDTAPSFLAWLREIATNAVVPKHVSGIAGVVLADDCFRGPWEPDVLRAHIAAVHCNEAGFWPVFADFIAHFNARRYAQRRMAGGA